MRPNGNRISTCKYDSQSLFTYSLSTTIFTPFSYRNTETAQNKAENASSKPKRDDLDMSHIKSMFDNIIKIQSNPDSKEAREFEKYIQDLERQNPSKRQTQMLVVKMKKGSVISNEKRTLSKGGMHERENLEASAYNYLTHQFPEENFLTDFDLHHYRYPAKGGVPDGIVFLNHDQSKYMGKYAHVAEMLADSGLEVFGFDLVGHGKNNHTPRGYFGTYKDVKLQLEDFITKTLKHFDYENKPKFAIGVSTSALTCLQVAMEKERLFNGINVINPLLKNEGVHPRLYRFSDFLGKVWPKFKMMSINAEQFQPFKDPLLLNGHLRAGLFSEIDNQSYHIRKNADKLRTPILIAHGGLDTITGPKTVRTYFENLSIEDKDIILYDDCGHDIYSSAEYYKILVKDQIMWMKAH